MARARPRVLLLALLAPVARLATKPAADAQGTLFVDGFEGGDTWAWQSEPPASACPLPASGPTFHSGVLTAAETRLAGYGPHVVTADLTVPAGVTLTLAPCTEVRLRPNVYLLVDGELVAGGLPGGSSVPAVTVEPNREPS